MSRVFEAETKMIEFKREYTRNILKTVSAFSNFHDGEIIIGIDNDFKIIGVDDPVQVKLNLENVINDNIIPVTINSRKSIFWGKYPLFIR